MTINICDNCGKEGKLDYLIDLCDKCKKEYDVKFESLDDEYQCRIKELKKEFHIRD